MKIDYTSRDFNSIKKDLTNNLNILAPELSNRSDAEFTMVMIELFSYVGDVLSYMLDRYAGETNLITAVQRESVIKRCQQLGYKLRNRIPSKVVLTFTIDAIHDKDIIIPAKTLCYTSGINKVKFETDELAIIKAGETFVEVSAHEGETVTEVIGYSDGTADQEFQLNYYPALDGVEIYVDTVKYEEVDNFINSSSMEKSLIVENYGDSKTKIIFGNGINGEIPQEYAEIFASYRVGGGLIGNVSVGTIINIDQQIFDSDNEEMLVYVTNNVEAKDGLDEEDIDTAKIKAPIEYRTLKRAVTLLDFEEVAKLLDTTRLVSAIKNDSPNTVDVHILPVDGESLTPTQTAMYQDYYGDITIVGTTTNIYSPSYKNIDVTINARTYANRSNLEIQSIIGSKVREITAIGKYNFGQEFIIGELIKELMVIDGVKSISFSAPTDDVIALKSEIIVIDNLIVNVTGGV